MNKQELNRTYDQITEQLNKLHTIVSGFQDELGSFLQSNSPKNEKEAGCSKKAEQN